MKRYLVLLALALSTALSTSGAFADGPGGGNRGTPRGGGPHPMMPFPLRSLGLSDAQHAQVRQIVANHRPQFQSLNGQLRSVREQLVERLHAPGAIQPEDIAPFTQQISQLREQLARDSLQVTLEIRSVLTPEQLAKAAQIRQRMRDLQSQMKGLLGENY